MQKSGTADKRILDTHNAFGAVIGIVSLAIIAAIVFPLFAQRHYSGPGRSAIGNLKLIAIGFLMYAEDYDQHLPADASDSRKWTKLVSPYIKNDDVFVCRYDRAESDALFKQNGTIPYYKTHLSSFVANPLLLTQGRSLTNIENPESVLLLFEHRPHKTRSSENRIEVAFADGSVRMLNWQKRFEFLSPFPSANVHLLR